MFSVFTASRGRVQAGVSAQKAREAAAQKKRLATSEMKGETDNTPDDTQQQQHIQVEAAAPSASSSSSSSPPNPKRLKVESIGHMYSHPPIMEMDQQPYQAHNDQQQQQQQQQPPPPPPAPRVSSGLPVPVSFPSSFVVPNSHNPYAHLAARRQQPNQHQRQHQQHGRAIRGPHRVPGVQEMEEDTPYLTPAPAPAPPAPATTAIVDLTSDGQTTDTNNTNDDVQLLSHSYNAFPTASSDTPIAAYDPYAYDPYAAAFRAASKSYTYDSPPVPTAASSHAGGSTTKPISASQFGQLSKEQQAVILAIQSRESVFFSGCAGTGKSHLLKLLTQFLPRSSTFFTASTGLAAVNIGGITLHSFAGVGLGEGSIDTLAAKARGNKAARQRWIDCNVLVVDEISMIAGTFFDKLEAIARKVRNNPAPFGGIQLILSGDFLQLPPVKAMTPTFRAACWDRCIKRRIVLTTVFRQKGDPTFINLLNNLRIGQLGLKDEATLKKSNFTRLSTTHGIVATKLNSLKRDTADENEKELEKLPSQVVFFKAVDAYRSEAHMELLRKNGQALDILKLKQGAQVMLLKNLAPEAGLCNGSRGIILDFVKIHAESGGYDAARKRAGDTDTIGINSTPYMTSEKNDNFPGGSTSTALGNPDEVCLLPRVQFDNGIIQVIESDKWEISVQEQVQASRRQIPLTLAWALTIHKSQGMTLERAEINAQGMFENGQLYVAVSRVKSLQGLKLIGFTRDCMRTDHTTVQWYKNLERETSASTQELLKQVDRYFPELQLTLEEERIKNQQQQVKEEFDKEIKRAGPFAEFAPPAAAVSHIATSSSNVSTGAPKMIESPQKPHTNGFARASSIFASNHDLKQEPLAASSSISISSPSAAAVSVSRPPPKPFRSPLKDPLAAAISTAIATAIHTGEDVIVNHASVDAAHPHPVESHPPSSSQSASQPAASQSQSQSPSGAGSCCMCKDAPSTIAISECMHLCLCEECAAHFAVHDGVAEVAVRNRCPICQGPIKKIQKIFFA